MNQKSCPLVWLGEKKKDLGGWKNTFIMNNRALGNVTFNKNASL